MSSYYVLMAEQQDRQPFRTDRMGVVDDRAFGLRCFRRYSRNATVDVGVMADGREHWLAPKQSRIWAIVQRELLGDGRTTMKAIAQEANVHPTTVSRTLTKLEAWGEVAVDVVRGKYGGIRLWRPISDRFRLYAIAARQRIARAARHARSKVASTLTSWKREGRTTSNEDVDVTGRNFKPPYVPSTLDLILADEIWRAEGKRRKAGSIHAED